MNFIIFVDMIKSIVCLLSSFIHVEFVSMMYTLHFYSRFGIKLCRINFWERKHVLLTKGSKTFVLKRVKPWMEKTNNIAYALTFWVYSVGYAIGLPMINPTIEMSTTPTKFTACTHKSQIHSNSKHNSTCHCWISWNLYINLRVT